MNKGIDSRDRAIGCMVGLAVGDAVGTTVEFKERGRFPPLTDMVGGGPFDLPAGAWTDDTSMSLCLADALLADPNLDQRDLMDRFVRWYRDGENSSTGRCFDIGNATRTALKRFERHGDAVAGSTDPHSAGNGSIMRLAPVAVTWWNDPDRAEMVAVRQGETTHRAPATLDACRLLARLLCAGIAGASRDDLLAPLDFEADPSIAEIAAGAWRNKDEPDISSSGYVVHTTEAALWCVCRAHDFRDAILTAANLGEDADTVAAVTGQIAGAVWGLTGIPDDWLERLYDGQRIEALAGQLFDQAAVRHHRR